MANFTEGGWHVELGEVHEVRDAAGGRICILTQLRGRHGLGGRRADGESAANAHLIAASPDLHESLQQMVRLIVELYPGHVEPEPDNIGEYEAVWAAVSNARAALSKATGVALHSYDVGRVRGNT